MIFINQKDGLSELQLLAYQRGHNILIEGTCGCGKTYLAKQYANMLGIDDFQIVEPLVNSVKDAIESCYQIDNPVVLCIENLDVGVQSVSYAMLKFLEEPPLNVYIVITCRCAQSIPDTIISRSYVVSIPPVHHSDLEQYAQHKDFEKYKLLQDSSLWKCVSSINDVDVALTFNQSQIDYFDTIPSILSSQDSISSIVWKLQKFPDGTSTPIDIIIKYIMSNASSSMVWTLSHICLQSLYKKRISTHAILAKFLFEYKYCINSGGNYEQKRS